MEIKINTMEDKPEILSYIDGEKKQKIVDSEAKVNMQLGKRKKKAGEHYVYICMHYS